MPHAVTDQEVLSDYWGRLDTLKESEWSDFYRRVCLALRRCPASELASLPDSRDSYIHEFFTEKIYFRAQRMPDTRNQTISGGALCFFFRNYLRDRLRGRGTTGETPDPREPPDVTVAELLDLIGGPEALARSVDDFLVHLEDWALLMLRGHFCADDDEAIPMSKLCKGVAAYHYKAQKLGITVRKNAEGFLGYEHTRIGQWIKAMGIDIVPENHPAIRFLLEALCLEATVIAGEGAP